jgi:hypothetical protein
MPSNCFNDELAHTDEELRLTWCHCSLKERSLYGSIGSVRWAKGVVKAADQTSSNFS